jgi:FKBP-type peptidyl-prolyl cis-trans isomerase SlyD
MQIENGAVVSFHYTLSDTEGKIVEDSRAAEPTVYLHGARNILPALEAAFVGKTVGESFQVRLSAAQGYGERKPDAIERVPAKYLKHAGKLRPGQAVRLNTEQGVMLVTVVKVGKFSVDVDSNHPLAGQELDYAVEIVDVRPATDEEKAHGHAHGEGGHHH